VLRASGRHAEALDVYRRWLAEVPSEDLARVEAVELALGIDRAADAVVIAREGVTSKPGGDSHRLLGMALAGSGQVRDAVGELRAAQKSYGAGAPSDGIEKVLTRVRATAPDSLRSFLTADSVAHRGR
jgi:hypothetical protein